MAPRPILIVRVKGGGGGRGGLQQCKGKNRHYLGTPSAIQLKALAEIKKEIL
jgi:hypothetical protein